MTNTTTNIPAQRPTISIQSVDYPDGSYGVNVFLTGLTSPAHADAACEHMALLFCGDEIKMQG